MERAQAREHLRSVQVLSHLSDDTLDQLAQVVRWRVITTDQQIVTLRERANSVFFIVSGGCRVKLTGAAGRVIALRRLPAGSHLGEITALTGERRTVDVVAEAGSLLAECPGDAFDALMNDNAPFAKAIAASLARTVMSLTERAFELATLEVRFRLYAELLRLAATGQVTPDGILITDMPTQDTLAATIGSQRTAVNRELQFLVREGMIEMDRRTLLIRDIEKLRELFRSRSPGAPDDDADDDPGE